MGHVWRIELMFSNAGLRKTDLMHKQGKQRLGKGKGGRCQVESLSASELVHSPLVVGLSHLIMGITETDNVI